MGLETQFNSIDDLNVSWPLGTDPKSEGDNHLRGIKNAIKGNVRGDGLGTQLRIGADNVVSVLPGSTTHNRPSAGVVDLATAILGVNKAILRGDAGVVQLRAPVQGDVLELWTNGAVAGEVAAIQCVADGAVQINYRGRPNIIGNAQGATVRRVTGETVTLLALHDDGGVVRAEVAQGLTTMVVRGRVSNAPIDLYASRAGADEPQARFDPVAGPTFYRAGARKMNFSDNGFNFYGAGVGAGAVSTLSMFDENAINLLQFQSNASYAGILSRVAAKDFNIYVADAGGTLRQRVQMVSQGDMILYGADAAAKLRVLGVGTTQNSAARVLDGIGTARAVGFNTMPRSDQAVSRALTTNDSGNMLYCTAVLTITLNTAIFGDGEVVAIMNGSAGNLTIAQGAGFGLTWNQGGATSSGPRTVAPGSVVTLWFPNSTSAFIWGNGLS